METLSAADACTLAITVLGLAGLIVMCAVMRGMAWGIWWLPAWMLGAWVLIAVSDVLHAYGWWTLPQYAAWRRVGFRGLMLVGIVGRVWWLVQAGNGKGH